MDTALPPDDADPQTMGATVKRDDLHSVRKERGGGPKLRRSTNYQLAHMYTYNHVATMYLEISEISIIIILYPMPMGENLFVIIFILHRPKM